MSQHYKELIPKEIIDLMNLNRFDLRIYLDAKSAQETWPMVKIEVNNQIIFDDLIVEHQEICYSLGSTENKVTVKIFYYGKTQDHTVVENGSIVEDQHVVISKILINDVDIVEKNIVYNCGCFHTESGTSHTLGLYSNGYWQLEFELPIYNFFTKLKGHRESWEKWPDPELINSLLTTLKNISN